jgi:hypothetical protein
MKTYIKNLEIAVIGSKKQSTPLPVVPDQKDSQEQVHAKKIRPQASLQAPGQNTANDISAKELIPFDDDELKDF